MNNVLIHRMTKNGNIRYYSIEIIATLFEEYIVERVYGNVGFKSCTGRRNNVFPSFDEAQIFFEKLKRQKMKKGYAQIVYLK